MNRRSITVLVLLLLAATAAAAADAQKGDAQKAAGVDVSRWRGFNLLEKFTLGNNAPFVEDDFRWIAEFGFNYVRLPIDYRCYVEKDDWLKFKEPVLRQIDEAVAFGEKHKLHVCINLHRAPGYCINSPPEPTDLWTDAKALDAFAEHWAMFARRYRNVPSTRLSFNLLNEPARTTRENYLKVFRRAIEAIHKEDPSRLIVVDGMNVGKDPIEEFIAVPNLVQSTRGYAPSQISHYKANWVKGSDSWPEPTWPLSKINSYLYGPMKPELRSALVLRGDFAAGAVVELKLARISQRAKLAVTADGKAVIERMIDPKTDAANWKQIETEKRYPLHEAAKELKLSVKLPACREVAIENVDGDWVTFSELAVALPGQSRRVFSADGSWGNKQQALRLAADGRLLPPPGVAEDRVLVEYLKPWVEISRRGESVFVGEWGAFNKTPHPVTLAWMKAWLEQWKQARFGWALWNFRGSFGILDSGRADVQYEEFRGHKLDREMLNLLQQYLDDNR